MALDQPIPAPGAGDPGSGPGPVGQRYDLRSTEFGLIVARSQGDGSVPDLVPWSAVSNLSAEGVADLPDGSPGRVFEIEVTDGDWLRGDRVRRFLAPTAEMEPFLLAASSDRDTTAGSDAREVAPAGRSGVAARAAGSLRLWVSRWSTGGPDAGQGGPGSGRGRVGPVAVALLALVLLAGGATTSFESAGGASAQAVPRASGQDSGNGAQALQGHAPAHLRAATTKPAPAPPSLAGSPPLQSHEVFGYAPYWTLPQSAGFDVKDLTTLAYFSVDANGDGTLDESGSGWNGYESQDLVNLVNRSHRAGDRVVLTVTDFSQSSLDAITSDPAAGARLSAALIAAVSAKNLDGVNFDFEGEGSGDRRGLTRLITQVSKALHGANPHWQVTMATYASAASDGAGFYDVAALAPAVDGFFVMAYDMNDRSTPSATSPLVGGGYNDTEALRQFTSVVPRQKVILGIPYYGYDWPTTDGTRTAQATGGETPLSDGVIAASGHPTYWDPSTQTAWTSYQVGTQWHETYFDNPTSLALKARLANSFGIAGVGIWALGMDGNNPAMLAALLGNAPAAKDYQAGPTTVAPGSSTTTPTVPGAHYVTTGIWRGKQVKLAPVAALASAGTAQFLGTLTRIATNDPALACLQSGPPLNVWTFSSLPRVDVVVASQPEDCAAATWTFTPPPAVRPVAGSKPTTTTTTTVRPTTTTTTTSTTVPPSTTTTTSTVPTSTTTTTSSTTTTTLAPQTPGP